MSYKLTCQVEECTDEELNVYEDATYYENEKGNHECVVFIQKTTNIPQTKLWKRGVKVKDTKQGDIAKGTVIATFDEDGSYPTDSLGKHAAIYLRHTNDYIEVYDQWNAQGKVKKRKIKFDKSITTKRSNNGDTFFVVELVTQKSPIL